jgi:cytoskeletal protein CcmA (bactofilin family)
MRESRINGLGKVHKGKFDNILIEGIGILGGDIEVENIKVHGLMLAKGMLKVSDMILNGTIRLAKGIDANTIQIDNGTIISKSKIYASLLDCKGNIRIKGDINSETVKIYGKGKANSIVGDSIFIKSKSQTEKGRRTNHVMNGVANNRFIISRIEGSVIDVDSINCKRIEGDFVKVKGKSIVGQIYYTKSLEIDADCKVDKIVRHD